MVLGQDLPEESASAQLQTFALIVAVIGLAAFALVLALIEQLVLSVLEEQVRRGSRVYERHHVRCLPVYLRLRPACICDRTAIPAAQTRT